MSFPPNPPSSEFVYVPVPVAKLDRVLRLLVADEDTEASGDGTRSLLTRIYRESETQFRNLLRLLAAYPGEPRSTEVIARDLGLPSGAGSLAGMLGAYARRAKSRYDGFWPFERLYDSAAERSELVMSAEIAAIVKELSAELR